MKLNVQIFLLCIIFTSCGVTKKSSTIKMIDGYYYYEQASPQMKAQLLGDYYFQPFKTKYFRDIDKQFIKYVTHKLDNIKPDILYHAHTIVQPYYSNLCLQYKTNSFDTTIVNDIKFQLKDFLNIKSPDVKKIKCGSKDVYKLKYQTTNPLNKINVTHTEYFFRNGGYIYRLFFWTIDTDYTVISEEAEIIIKRMSFE